MLRRMAVVAMVIALFLTGCTTQAKVDSLRAEGDKLAAQGNYLQAAEKYKQGSALLQGEKYVPDPAPEQTMQKSYQSNWEKLSITDTTVTKDSINATLTGNITNNGAVTLDGYFDVYFLDGAGKVVQSYIGRLPLGGLAPGKTSRFSVLINQFAYASYSFEGSAIGEKR